MRTMFGLGVDAGSCAEKTAALRPNIDPATMRSAVSWYSNRSVNSVRIAESPLRSRIAPEAELSAVSAPPSRGSSSGFRHLAVARARLASDQRGAHRTQARRSPLPLAPFIPQEGLLQQVGFLAAVLVDAAQQVADFDAH